MPKRANKKLYQVLPEDLRRVAPFSLLLANKVPVHCAGYPLAFWIAIELPKEIQERYWHYSNMMPSV